MKIGNILILATSNDEMGDSNRRTGVWLEELAAPYYIFKEAGAVVTLASPGGSEVPLDPKSQSIIVATTVSKRFLKDEDAMNWVAGSLCVKEVKPEEYDMVFVAGGHGAMWDLADNTGVKQLLEAFITTGKPVGAVCHGVAALLSLQAASGEAFISGKQLTGFSNREEESAGLTAIVPFLLETALVARGALYSSGDNYTSHVVVENNLVTGQNPASSADTARKMISLLRLKEEHAHTVNRLLAGKVSSN